MHRINKKLFQNSKKGKYSEALELPTKVCNDKYGDYKEITQLKGSKHLLCRLCNRYQCNAPEIK